MERRFRYGRCTVDGTKKGGIRTYRQKSTVDGKKRPNHHLIRVVTTAHPIGVFFGSRVPILQKITYYNSENPIFSPIRRFFRRKPNRKWQIRLAKKLGESANRRSLVILVSSLFSQFMSKFYINYYFFFDKYL